MLGGMHNDLEGLGIRLDGNQPWIRHTACIMLAALGAGCDSGVFTYGSGIYAGMRQEVIDNANSCLESTETR